MIKTLGCGQYAGQVALRQDLAGLILTETRYAAGQATQPHAHRSGYLCYVLNGSFVETIGRQQREYAAGSVGLHPPEEWHGERFHTSVRSFNIELPANGESAAQRWQPLFALPRHFTTGPASHWLKRLAAEFRQPDEVTPLAMEAALLELLVWLHRRPRPASRPRWLDRVVEKLRATGMVLPTLDELAADAGVHPGYLATVFRQHLGCTIGEFWRRQRLERATDLLMNTRLPVAEVALRCGFADQSHFTRQFHQVMGQPPATYRRGQ